MSLNPLKTKYPATSLVLVVLLCTSLGAIIGLYFYESEVHIFNNVDKIIPVHTILGSTCGAAVGLLIGVPGTKVASR